MYNLLCLSIYKITSNSKQTPSQYLSSIFQAIYIYIYNNLNIMDKNFRYVLLRAVYSLLFNFSIQIELRKYIVIYVKTGHILETIYEKTRNKAQSGMNKME